LNRRSTTRWTRLRNGLNAAAATSVEAATATDEDSASTWVESRTRPAYAATSSPVTSV
jgi:hypothetical protein